VRETVRWSVPFHEAGHAVVAWRRGLKAHGATIVPSLDFLGSVQHANPLRGIHLEWDGSGRARLGVETGIVVLLAAPAAQRRFKPRSWRSYYGVSDHERAADLAMAICSSEKAVSAYLKWLEIMADDEVAAFWDLIERTARELFERRTLSAAEIAACCRKPVG
jgi:hypothetical protein